MKVGDKVVCVEVSDHGAYSYEVNYAVPDEKTIYTIRNLLTEDGVEGLRLEEIINIYSGRNTEYGFLITDFRVIESKPFRNALTKELMVKVLTGQDKSEIERIEIKEKETV